MIDNTTAIHCLHRGGARNPQIHRIVENIWLLAAKHCISPIFRYIPTKENDIADALSRGSCNSSAPIPQISKAIFDQTEAKCSPHSIDLMANSLTNQCPRFRSRCDSVFSHPLDNENAWCNPDHALIGPLLTHYFDAKGRAPRTTHLTLVAPEWPHQPWWPHVKGATVMARFPIGTPLYQTADGSKEHSQWPVLILRWGPCLTHPTLYSC